jgi:Uma2 family endonuclease
MAAGYDYKEMAMSTATTQPATYGLDASIPRFSVPRYQRMIETGILTPDDKVELLENYVVLKMSRNPRHDDGIHKILDTIYPRRPAGWTLRIQSAIVLSDSQPEPDFTLARGSRLDYQNRHPAAADVGLLIEVADSSLLRDQRDKTRIYGRANIPCYWIVNLVDNRIEVYTQPSGPTPQPAYGSFQLYQPGDVVPLMLDGNLVGSFAASDLIP